MPLDPLTQPALTEPITHLEADNLMLGLHQEVKEGESLVLALSIEDVTLHNVLCRLPCVLLALMLCIV